MKNVFLKRMITYSLYCLFSVGVGYVSLLGGTDYVAEISKSIIPILMTLMSLYAVISGQLITRLISAELDKDGLSEVVDAMERNVVIEAILLAITFAFLASFSWLRSLLERATFLCLFRNALVCFDFLYFVYVVYDSTIGLYHLLKK